MRKCRPPAALIYKTPARVPDCSDQMNLADRSGCRPVSAPALSAGTLWALAFRAPDWPSASFTHSASAAGPNLPASAGHALLSNFCCCVVSGAGRAAQMSPVHSISPAEGPVLVISRGRLKLSRLTAAETYISSHDH